MIILTSNTMEAHILPRGATLAGLWIKGVTHSLCLGFADRDSFSSCPIYAGALVGPVANRISRGRVRIGSKVYQMPSNEGTTCLHSGEEGLHARDWQVTDQTPSSVTLALSLPDGAIGLPGHREFTARYALTLDRSLSLVITAATDLKTVVNVAHHPYWSLDDLPDISGHRLKIQADSYLPVDDTGLPTGEIASVADTRYDFRHTRSLSVEHPLDANLCLSHDRVAAPRLAATLVGATGVRMNLLTTEPGLQIYNGSGLPSSAPSALPGQTIKPYAGIALEPQGWPDAPNRSAFAPVILAQGAQYRQETIYRFASNSP
ncbi:aldose epimerase family protein [uncultured Roseobacter sp.]|uniref:aldose epimerase family protein n=1 Tax=uncultured Roseobacter sp. TaxID=114847 RepID=UPI00262AFF7D|nr:aldose epimerase family protein [uncultured Roseobacter sp.]